MVYLKCYNKGVNVKSFLYSRGTVSKNETLVLKKLELFLIESVKFKNERKTFYWFLTSLYT